MQSVVALEPVTSIGPPPNYDVAILMPKKFSQPSENSQPPAYDKITPIEKRNTITEI